MPVQVDLDTELQTENPEDSEHRPSDKEGPLPWGGRGFSIIVVFEIESKMIMIYCNLQWVMPAWHAFFILASTGQHLKENFATITYYYYPTCCNVQKNMTLIRHRLKIVRDVNTPPHHPQHPAGEHARASAHVNIYNMSTSATCQMLAMKTRSCSNPI